MLPRHADEQHREADRDPPVLPSAPPVEVLARFVFVESDDDEPPHIHSERCTCQLRGR